MDGWDPGPPQQHIRGAGDNSRSLIMAVCQQDCLASLQGFRTDVLIKFTSSFCGAPLGSTPGGHCFLGISASLVERLPISSGLSNTNTITSATPGCVADVVSTDASALGFWPPHGFHQLPGNKEPKKNTESNSFQVCGRGSVKRTGFGRSLCGA